MKRNIVIIHAISKILIKSIYIKMKKIFWKKNMTPGGYLIIILQNVRHKYGTMKLIEWQLALTLKEDLNLGQEFIYCQDQKDTKELKM